MPAVARALLRAGRANAKRARRARGSGALARGGALSLVLVLAVGGVRLADSLGALGWPGGGLTCFEGLGQDKQNNKRITITVSTRDAHDPVARDGAQGLAMCNTTDSSGDGTATRCVRRTATTTFGSIITFACVKNGLCGNIKDTLGRDVFYDCSETGACLARMPRALGLAPCPAFPRPPVRARARARRPTLRCTFRRHPAARRLHP